MIKTSIFQIINSLIIIVLVNTSVDYFKKSNQQILKEFPFFTGKYSDLSPEWFYIVGVTISFYMILNIVTPHVSGYLAYLMNKISRCYDRCCSKNKYSSYLTKEEYFELYVGPDFSVGERYAQILNTIFIAFTLSSGMPILYICTFLFLFLTYWIDKFMILRFYKTPPQMDLYLSKMFELYIYILVIIHLCFGIWIYGNNAYFDEHVSDIGFIRYFNDLINIQIKNFQEDDPNFKTSFSFEIIRRMIKPHNIFMIIFLILVILYYLFSTIIIYVLKFILCTKYWKCEFNKKNKFKTYENIYESKFNFFLIIK
jgi:hypothetical protein